MRRIHEGTDSLEEQLAAVTDQQETKPSNESATKESIPEVVAENVEVDGVDADLSADAGNKGVKGTSTSSSEEIDEEALEGDGVSKIGKDGTLRKYKFLLQASIID